VNQPPDDQDDGKRPAGSYDVGYRKPPAEHRFKKGQSGNPLGRPRKKRVSGRRTDPAFGTQLADGLLLEEAYRPVTVREGGKTYQIPAIQAVHRAMFVDAVRG